jgi:colicin import membrane protein
MKADPQAAPTGRQRSPGRAPAIALAVLVHLALLAVLVFSLRWQSSPAEPVSAELYAPSNAAPAPKPLPPQVEPTPQPPVPTPTPTPEPAPQPAPPPPVVAPPPPDTRAADLAIKAAKDETRRRQEAQQRALAEKQEHDRKEAERKQAEDKQRADDKRLADTRARQQQETNALLAQAANEAQARTVAAQRSAAQDSAQRDWLARIQAKVRGNVILPGDLSGNPQAEFDVTELPTGEIIDVKLRKSSGVPAYDDAVQRAILKSSPLPRPDNPNVWQRNLKLVFRPKE